MIQNGSVHNANKWTTENYKNIYWNLHISRHSSTTVYQAQYCDQTKPTVGIVDQTSIPLLGSAGNVQE